MGLKPGWQGRFFEDLEPGDHYQHPLGRTVTESDNTWFTLLRIVAVEQLSGNGAFGR